MFNIFSIDDAVKRLLNASLENPPEVVNPEKLILFKIKKLIALSKSHIFSLFK